MDRDVLAKPGVRYAKRAEPVSLTLEELDFGHCPVTFGGARGAGVGVDPLPLFGGAGGRRDVRLDVSGGAGVLDGRRVRRTTWVWASGAAAERSGG